MNEHYDIFISYRRDGGFETAKHLNDLLVHDGYTVSFDIDTLREGDFDDALLKRVDQCVDFILVVDKHTFDRTLDPDFSPKKDWLRRELAYALKLRKNIIPVLLSGVNGFPFNLPKDIADVAKKHGPEYNKFYFDEFYRRLKSFLHCHPRLNAQIEKKVENKLADKYEQEIEDYKRKVKMLKEESNKLNEEFQKYKCQKEKDESQIANNKKKEKKYKLLAFIGLVFSVLALSYLCLTLLKLKKKEPPLFIVGGGSVYNYITKNTPKDIREKDNILYVNLTSGSAFDLLFEEVLKNAELGDKSREDFSTICLSAHEVKESDLNETFKQYLNDARTPATLVEYYLGKDTMAVYMSQELAEMLGYDKEDRISADNLRNIIDKNRNRWKSKAIEKKDSVFRLFTTTERSGTIRSYHDILYPDSDSIFSLVRTGDKNLIFHQYSNPNIFENSDSSRAFNRFMILGSDYYYPMELYSRPDSNKPVKLHVFTIERETIYSSKNMFLYFAAYNSKEDGIADIRLNIVDFLKSIGADHVLEPNLWKNQISKGIIVRRKDYIQRLNPPKE